MSGVLASRKPLALRQQNASFMIVAKSPINQNPEQEKKTCRDVARFEKRARAGKEYRHCERPSGAKQSSLSMHRIASLRSQ
jgi:hypothetical protein